MSALCDYRATLGKNVLDSGQILAIERTHIQGHQTRTVMWPSLELSGFEQIAKRELPHA